MSMTDLPIIEVRDLTMSYGERVIQRDMNFSIKRNSVFVIMGGSGCGKSTLLRHLVGLILPAKGEVRFAGVDIAHIPYEELVGLRRKFGILYQGGALWSSLTLGENIAYVLQQYTDWNKSVIRQIASYKLSLVGLAGFDDYYPSEISGGMRKRAGLARALAFDPEIVFFDEPSAGLDPVSSKRLDDLIMELKTALGTTVVVVTHELDSIFSIADDSIFLDSETQTIVANGRPLDIFASTTNKNVKDFLSRGESRAFV